MTPSAPPRRWLVLAPVLLLALSACTTIVGPSADTGTDVTPSVPAQPATSVAQPTSPAETGLPEVDALDVPSDLDLYDVSDLVKAVRDGVVSVTQARVVVPLFGGPTEVPAGTGTGIVIDRAGHILTNHHVVAGASRIFVTARDGRNREATLVGIAPHRDLALLRVSDTEGLRPLPLGDSSSLEVGDPVVAIGNALGLDVTSPSVSAGILSAKERRIATETGTFLEHLLQTDAAINPGNSGGPLLDARGNVVGVNTAIAAAGQNIGFAISIDSAKPTIRRFLTGVGEPILGVSLIDNSPVAKEQLGLAIGTGALVLDVVPDGPAARAGIVPGDVIVEIEGAPVTTAQDVIDILDRFDPGDTVTVVVDRGGERRSVEVVLGERSLRP